MSSYRRQVALLDDAGKVRLLQRLEAQRARSHARSVEVIAALRAGPSMVAGVAPVGVEVLSPEAVTESEVAAALRVSALAAQQQVRSRWR